MKLRASESHNFFWIFGFFNMLPSATIFLHLLWLWKVIFLINFNGATPDQDPSDFDSYSLILIHFKNSAQLDIW